MRAFAPVVFPYKLCSGTDFTIQLEPYCHPHPTGFSSRSSLLCRSPSGDVLGRHKINLTKVFLYVKKAQNTQVFVCY